MLDINDAKVLISAYRFIEKNCDLINEFVYKHAINFGPSPEYCSTYDVTNNIINLIERKNRLINFKLIIDELVNSLDNQDKLIILSKMRFNLSMQSFCQIFDMPSVRTAFRRVQTALEHFLRRANNSPYREKLEYLLDNEGWIIALRHKQLKQELCMQA
ncbi:MAG: hypothetical protein IJ371_01700 [Clostridia bacterium]|nr:hypothetical protein [Clostridia bacterium]